MVTDPVDGITTYVYDNLGNLLSQTSPVGWARRSCPRGMPWHPMTDERECVRLSRATTWQSPL